MRKRLRAAPEAIPLAERRDLTRQLAEALGDGNRSEAAIRLVDTLAADPKWEVRTDVADLLVSLPDDHFARVAAGLCADTNSFVRKAAERALDRRRRGQKAASRVRREFDQIHSQYEAFEKMHGKLAAQRSRKIAERLFDHLIGATVHEMRGILTPLKAGTASLLHHLDDGVMDQAKLRRRLLPIADRLAFLERLIDDMRAYSQSPVLERRRERLSDLVAEALTMVRDNLQAKDCNTECIQVHVAVPAKITLDISRHQVVVAIRNVVKNAFESFADGPHDLRPGRIGIRVQTIGEEAVEIVVEDTGMGIAEEDLQEILQFIPGKSTKRNWGTGFGLPIAKRNVALHGGSLAIESNEDKGTRVTIVLPVQQQREDWEWSMKHL
jgi:signal transduction histidine kinase